MRQLMTNLEEFLNNLFSFAAPNVFNPYQNHCIENDLPGASIIRRINFESVLKFCTTNQTKAIWIARDLGYLGGRRTGLALTDEANLSAASNLYGGIKLKRATRGKMFPERTASIIWQMLGQIESPVMLWNVFPFHPHLPGDQMSNRRHTLTERKASAALTHALVEFMKPNHIIAIGRDAEKALRSLNIPVYPVRHPSYGGQAEFVLRIKQIYGLIA